MHLLSALATLPFLAIPSAFAATANISVDAGQIGPRIPKNLCGVFLEEISHAGEERLYAELIQNRGFEDANLPASAEPAQTNFNVANARGLKAQGSVTVLTSGSPSDENSFANPQKIVPVKSPLTGVAPSFQHTLPPYSLSILRLKTR